MSATNKPLPKVSDGEKEDTEMKIVELQDDDDLLHAESRKPDSVTGTPNPKGYGGVAGPSSLLSIPSTTEGGGGGGGNGKGYGTAPPSSALMSSNKDSEQYEEIGPSSVNSINSLPSEERREKNKALGIFTKTDAKTGVVTKWRVKRRAGYAHKESNKREKTSREKPARKEQKPQEGIAEIAEAIVSESDSSIDEDDDRFGDAQDRVSWVGGFTGRNAFCCSFRESGLRIILLETITNTFFPSLSFTYPLNSLHSKGKRCRTPPGNRNGHRL